MPKLKELLRSPLLHFFLLGALLLLVYTRFGPASANAPIVLSADFVEGLGDEWAQRNGRPSGSAPLDALTQQHVNDEVLYREAKALNLDEGDLIVRRRLIQKMRFLIEDVVTVESPSPSQLLQLLKARPERYRSEDQLRITQVFLPEGDARMPPLVQAARAGAAPDALAEKGAPLPIAPSRGIERISRLQQDFGEPFARALRNAPEGQWIGPLSSPFGRHLVFVHEHRKSPAPKLEDPQVKRQLQIDWREARRAELNAQVLSTLRAKYEVRIERSAR